MNAFFSVPSACERRDPSCTPPYPSRELIFCREVFYLIRIVIPAAAAVVVVVVVVVVAVVAVFLLSLFRYRCCVSLRASAA